MGAIGAYRARQLSEQAADRARALGLSRHGCGWAGPIRRLVAVVGTKIGDTRMSCRLGERAP